MRILRLWPTEIGVKAGWLFGLIICIFSWLNPAVGQPNLCNVSERTPETVEGGFTVPRRACVGSVVTITNTKPTATSVKYIYGYTKDSSVASAGSAKTFNTFQKPGPYKILQAGSLNGTAMIHCEEITIVPRESVKFTVKTCSGRRAILIPDLPSIGQDQYDKYEVDWGDGSVKQTKTRAELAIELSHTYGNAGNRTYSVSLQGLYNDLPNCGSLIIPQSINFSADATKPAITGLYTSDENTIKIEYKADPGVSVELFQKTGTTGQKGTGSGLFTVKTDAKQAQCFQVRTQPACSTDPPLASDEVCNLILNATAGNKENKLTWQPYTGPASASVRKYEIRRNGTTSASVPDPAQTSYTDNNKIECGTQYCYQLVATIQGSVSATVTSNAACVIGSNGDAPGKVGEVIVTVEDGKPYLIVPTLPTGIISTGLGSYTMVVSRSNGASGSFQPIAMIDTKGSFRDVNVDASTGSYCYQVSFLSKCGQSSPPSEPACTVFLASKSTGIDWTAESPFSAGAVSRYTVEVIDSVNGTRREIELGGNTHYEPDPDDPNLQSQRYRIIAVASTGTQSYSNFFTFRREAKILVPDAFTPNGDGMNDAFLAKGIYVDQFLMTIYSRWGEVVYSTTDKTKGWDGMTNGQQATTGQYMYRIEVIDLTGMKTVRTGAVLLIR